MVFQLTIVFIRFLSYMVHPMKSFASVGLAQARPNYGSISIFTGDSLHVWCAIIVIGNGYSLEFWIAIRHFYWCFEYIESVLTTTSGIVSFT